MQWEIYLTDYLEKITGVPVYNSASEYYSENDTYVSFTFVTQKIETMANSGTIEDDTRDLIEIGSDNVDDEDNAYIQTYSPLVSFAVNIDIYGKDSLDVASKLNSSFSMRKYMSYLNANGLGFLSASALTNLASIIGNEQNESYQFTLDFTFSMDMVTNVEIVKKITIETPRPTTVKKTVKPFVKQHGGGQTYNPNYTSIWGFSGQEASFTADRLWLPNVKAFKA